MGFDGLFFGRLDYADKDKRLDTKTMEMIWKGESNIQARLVYPTFSGLIIISVINVIQNFPIGFFGR